MKERMQEERVAAFSEFIDDVQQGRFPGSEHIIQAPEDLVSQFLEVVGEQ